MLVSLRAEPHMLRCGDGPRSRTERALVKVGGSKSTQMKDRMLGAHPFYRVQGQDIVDLIELPVIVFIRLLDILSYFSRKSKNVRKVAKFQSTASLWGAWHCTCLSTVVS